MKTNSCQDGTGEKETFYCTPSNEPTGAEQGAMSKPYSKRAPAEAERSLEVALVQSQMCVH